MLQRIQTVFLALAALAFGSLFIGSVSFGDFTQPIEAIPASQDGFLNIADDSILFAITILGIVCSAVSILLFKNRPLQMRVVWLVIVAALALVIWAGWDIKTISENYMNAQTGDARLNISGVGFIPLILAIVFGYMALRNIRKDELLVRSSDRLR